MEVNTRNPVIHKDFASVNQTNHVILKVPDPSGDLWLECTNTDIPFGYIHQDIAGHDAIVYSDGTATIEKIPSYDDTLNRIETKVSARISSKGESYFKVEKKYINMCAEPLFRLSEKAISRQKEIIMSQLSVPACIVDSIQITEHHEQIPVVEMKYVCSSPSWVQLNSNILAIPVSIFKGTSPKFNRKRELDIQIRNGYVWKNTMTVELPVEYYLKDKTGTTITSSVCGSLSHKVSQEGNIINADNIKSISSGKRPKEKIGEIKEFFSTVSAIANKKIILRRK